MKISYNYARDTFIRFYQLNFRGYLNDYLLERRFNSE